MWSNYITNRDGVTGKEKGAAEVSSWRPGRAIWRESQRMSFNDHGEEEAEDGDLVIGDGRKITED